MAAFLAGYHPKKMPVTVHTIKARSTDHGSTEMRIWYSVLLVSAKKF